MGHSVLVSWVGWYWDVSSPTKDRKLVDRQSEGGHGGGGDVRRRRRRRRRRREDMERGRD